MDSRTTSRVSEWKSRPFGPQGTDLPALVESAFTGAVSVDDSWLFMLNGRGIGVFHGTVEDFLEGTGTAYVSPDPALPLLFTMWERGGETRAQYYTEKTAIAEVDATLSSSSFTGFIELSENVISGDYYVVYYGGRSMAVAFVGSSARLLTGDEAFEKANNEVGIYEVTAVDIDVLNLPGSASEQSSATTDPRGPDSTEPDEGTAGNDPEAESPPADSKSTTAHAADADLGVEATSPAEASEVGAAVADEAEPSEPVNDAATDDVETSMDAETVSTAADGVPESSIDPSETEASGSDQPMTSSSTDRSTSPSDRAPSAAPSNPPKAGVTGRQPTTDPDTEADDRDPFTAEAEWRERRDIPSLDPERTEHPPGGRSADSTSRPDDGDPQVGGGTADVGMTDVEDSATGGRQPSTGDAPADPDPPVGEGPGAESDDLAALRTELAAEREKRSSVETELASLRSEIERLEAALEESDGSGESRETAGSTITPQEALEGTNLFVRYATKGEATLEAAHAGEADRESVNANLQLEHHTTFDRSGVSIAGEGFESWLTGTIEYSFVQWIVEDLLYEIQNTGQVGALRDLYDAIPRIDRADFRGSMALQFTEDGEEHRAQQGFDIILRDRMGRPLMVIEINDSRDPASADEMADLIRGATRAKETTDHLDVAFFLTASYFEPEALETATEATGSGLLRRSSRKSYVKLSRKQGFHLCLVEARNGDFHVSVPEL